MSKNLFITGTGTDVGKTYVTGLILKKLNGLKKNAAYFKAAMSGNERGQDGKLIPGDAFMVKKMSGINQKLGEMCPFVYENAVSPHLASRIEGNPVNLSVVVEKFNELSKKYDYVTVEGSGGILCPLCFDEEKIQLEDVIKKLNLTSIIIADAGLGTINNVVLTAKYMKEKNMPVKGIIFNHCHHQNVMEKDNKLMCEYFTGHKTLACVYDDDTEISIDEKLLLSLYE